MSGDATRAELLAWHPFTLDRFQVEALDAIDADRSVLVAAPTGSGKTVVAEYAIARALAAGSKAFYTTPIKALSNQKYLDLRRRHGRDRVGLLTGDTSLDGESSAVVMTTEVLRNMLYERSRTLDRLSVVVLDEVHYLQDPYRGPVWEEIILHLPPEVRLVCLSATVSNAEELAAWLASVRGPTEVIVEHHRPVELHQHLVVGDREQRELRVVPVLAGGRPNPDGSRFDAEPGPRRGGGGRRRYATPRRDDVVELLQERDLLPALWFIFSRAGCEDAVRRARQDGIRLAPPEDRARIRAIVEQHTATLDDRDLDVLGYDAWLDALEVGIAAHHAGMVPAFKETVEHLFVEGLVRLVFATETLALGVNMPARAVIVEQLSKFKGDGHELLTPSEFTQLTGRAGRRGLDPEGHAFVLWSPFVRFDEVAALAGSRAFELRSAFRPTYNMAANLVRRVSRDEAHALLARSFGQFQADRGVVAVAQRLAQRTDRLDALRDAARCELGDVAEYARCSDAAREELRARRSATGPAASMRTLRPGEVVADPTSGASLAVVGVSQRRGGGTRVRAVDEHGHLRTFGDRDLDEPLRRLGRVDLPHPYAPKEASFRRAVGQALRLHRSEATGGAELREHADGDDEAASALAAHPVHACPERDEHLRAIRRLARGEREVQGLQRAVDAATDSLPRRFDRILEVLAGLGYVEGWSLTERGERLARTYHECDLLVAETMATGLLDGLDPPELAAVVSCLTYEHRRRDAAPTWSDRPPRVRDATAAIERLGATLAASERRCKVPPSRLPDDGFARYAHEWAGGAPLDEILGRDDPMPAGDFVRNAKILMDLLRQVSTLANDEHTAAAALEAARALERGVVAIAGDVGSGESDEDEAGDEGAGAS